MAIEPPAEILRLRAGLRDLVALSTIPLAWVGREPPAIAAGLADSLVGSLDLAFVFVRLRDPNGAAAVDATRGNAWKGFQEWMQRHLVAGDFSRKDIVPDVGGGAAPCRGIVIPVGVNAEGGLVAAASDRVDFPTEIDHLLLSVAANHAATAFQSARLIHQRKRAEEEVRQARDELEQRVVERTSQLIAASEALHEVQAQLAHVTRVTTLGEVTASFAHELNQPLAAIINNANACLGLLSSRRRDVSEMREALADIVGDAERTGAIIERVRGLAKRTPSEKLRVRLVDVVDDVLALAAAESNARQVRILKDLANDLPVVLADRIQLLQVLLNLVVNGMDAMSTVDDRERKLEIRGRPDTYDGRSVAMISVQDGGIGLRPGEGDRVFEAFYTTKAHGLGMGLAISRSIIEAHGGRLWAEFNPGPGATFCFYLPAATSERPDRDGSARSVG